MYYILPDWCATVCVLGWQMCILCICLAYHDSVNQCHYLCLYLTKRSNEYEKIISLNVLLRNEKEGRWLTHRVYFDPPLWNKRSLSQKIMEVYNHTVSFSSVLRFVHAVQIRQVLDSVTLIIFHFWMTIKFIK